jgi:hypothetical protein
MSLSPTRAVLCFLGGALAAVTLLAQAEPPILANGTTVPNWTVPTYRAEGAEGGLRTMTDIGTIAGSFVAMVPCRVFDTRNAPGAYGGPRLVANATRNFDIDSSACGPFPTGGILAYSLNFGAILPDAAGAFITIWPAGASMPTVSTMNPIQGTVVANAAIVPNGVGGNISVFPNTGVHLYGDINGYFTFALNPGELFAQVANNPGGGAGTFINLANTNGSAGVYGSVGPGFSDNQCCAPTGVIGKGAIAGVAGSSPERGTVGILVNGAGNLLAEGQLGRIGGGGIAYGANAFTNTAVNGSAGVLGTANAGSGYVFGVKGISVSSSLDSAGVKGVSGYGDPLGDTIDCGPCFASGLRGVSDSGGLGIIGIARAGSAVVGTKLNPSDNGSAYTGYLGAFGFAVYSNGNYGGTGAKFFVEPHPIDASKVIKYISLEGPEAGTYFRGKGRFQNGIATIDVPEDFRMVTDADGLSIQVTPIGEMATVAVQSIGLDRIVVRGSRNVDFFYTVNGVRRSFRDFAPIQDAEEVYMPEKPGVTLDSHGYLAADQKRALIQNGTYKPDGTVNMETAHRLGWDRIWAERERPRPQPEMPPSP